MADITVIMATRAEETLEAALKSLEQQTYRDFKIILYNDSGRDISKRITAFDGLSIKLINGHGGEGIASALNKAIDFVETEFIARMDADDFCLPYRFEAQKECLLSGNFDIIGSPVIRKIGSRISTFKLVNPDANISKALKYSSPIPHPTFFGRSAAFITLKYDARLRYSQDYDFLARASINGMKIGLMALPTLIYTVSNEKNHSKHYAQISLANQISMEYRKAMNAEGPYKLNCTVKKPSAYSKYTLSLRSVAFSQKSKLIKALFLLIYLVFSVFCKEQLLFNVRNLLERLSARKTSKI